MLQSQVKMMHNMIKEYTRGGSYKVFTKVGVPPILCEKV